MFSKLCSIFGSKTKAQEILLLLKDAKAVVRQGFYASELTAVQQFCIENNLFCIQSKFKVLLDDHTSFSNRGLRISEQDPRNGMFFVYISKNEAQAYLASYAELTLNHQQLGELLGYPDCCINFFQQQFSANNPNPEHLPTNPWTNLSKREQDCVLLSHFPCCSDCQKSIALAQMYYEVIAEHAPERAEALLTELKRK
jgi:hypothetical protein